MSLALAFPALERTQGRPGRRLLVAASSSSLLALLLCAAASSVSAARARNPRETCMFQLPGSDITYDLRKMYKETPSKHNLLDAQPQSYVAIYSHTKDAGTPAARLNSDYYHFQVCGTLEKNCREGNGADPISGAMMMYPEEPGSPEAYCNMGVLKDWDIQPVEVKPLNSAQPRDGIELSYNHFFHGHVDYCVGRPEKMLKIRVTCGQFVDEASSITINAQDTCLATLSITHPAGCAAEAAAAGMSLGTLLLIVGASAFVVYCAAGAAYRYRGGRRGVELVPNVDGWRNLPGLVKDGGAFAASKLRALNKGGGGAATASGGEGAAAGGAATSYDAI